MNNKIIQAESLSKQFALDAGFFAKQNKHVYAVNDVSFEITRGETYGLVGESGCGKTTTARLLVGMYKATKGTVLYTAENGDAENITLFNKKELCAYREKVKYIFQDPARSLNPRMSVYEVITAALRYSSQWKGKEDAYRRAMEIINEVGLTDSDLSRRPSEFSGGQRQRISIARALIMEPEMLICDEVVSALDVSIQGQILNLLTDLREKRKLSFMFITHDLRVACYFCDRIGVMYRGVLVEESPAADLYRTARHPYTKLLFNGAQGNSGAVNGEVVSVLSEESGCPFAPRCPFTDEQCRREVPSLRRDGNSAVRCWKA